MKRTRYVIGGISWIIVWLTLAKLTHFKTFLVLAVLTFVVTLVEMIFPDSTIDSD